MTQTTGESPHQSDTFPAILLGDLKIPDPTMTPTIMQTDRNKVSWACGTAVEEEFCIMCPQDLAVL